MADNFIKESFCGFVWLDEDNIPFSFQDNIVKLLIKDKSFMPLGENKVLPKYLKGVTEDNRDIIFMTNEKAQARFHLAGFGTPMYILSRSNMVKTDLSFFDKISFVGKTINSIHNPSVVFDSEFGYGDTEKINKGEIMLKTKPSNQTTKTIPIKILGTDAEFIYGVNTTMRFGNSADNSLGEVNSYISLVFKEHQPIEKIIDYYKIILRLVRFMVGQQNVDFDRIDLFQWNELENVYERRSNCIIKTSYKNTATKKPSNTINIHDIDEYIQKFINMFSDDDFSLDYLPKNNEDINSVDYNVVKNVCTSLEFEYDKSDINKIKIKQLNPLIKSVKQIVEDFKIQNNEWFDERLNNYIIGNINHWQMPATKQFLLLYENNKDQLLDLCFGNGFRKDIEVSEDSIGVFVKLRNDITHGDKPPITQDDANFCYIMMALIYCSLLTRADLDKKDIKAIIDKMF